MHLGNRIKRLREKNRISRIKFCSGAISPSHFSNIENNRYTPSNEMISVIAEKLNVPQKYLKNVNEIDKELDYFLNKFEDEIENRKIEKMKIALSEIEDSFPFISSLKQEFRFSLLKFIFLIEINQIEIALDLYSEQVLNVECDLQSQHELNEKYCKTLGLYFFYKGEYTKSIVNFKNILDSKETSLKNAETSFYIGRSLLFLYRFQEALEYLENSKNIYLLAHEWERSGYCYDLLALVYRELGDLDEAKDLVLKGLHVTSNQSEILLSKLYYDLALINEDYGNYNEALTYIEKSITLKEKNETEDIYISHHVRLSIFLSKNDLISFKRHLSSASKSIRSIKDKGAFLYIQARLHYQLGEFNLYETYINDCIVISNSVRDLKNFKLATEHYANYLEKNNKYKKALEYYKLSMSLYKKVHHNTIIDT